MLHSSKRTACALKWRLARLAHGVGCLALLMAPGIARGQSSDATPKTASGATEAKATASSEQPPTKDQCLQAHAETQAAQQDGKLGRARENARVCASLACPGLIVSDCARWLTDLDQRMPSVVFEVRVNGQVNSEVLVFADGTRVQDWTKGESLRLDPGEHEFRFEHPPFEPILRNVLLGEGVRYRVVTAEFGTAAPATPTAPAATATPRANQQSLVAPPVMERPMPRLVYPLLGVAGLGLGGFAVFGLIGNSKQKGLESRCQPNCTDTDLAPMKTAHLIADVSLGVGVAGLVAAGVVYLARPEKPVSTSVAVTPLPGGAASYATYSF
ncbi:MAG: hypothetical protein ACOY0T_27785 [Myxococcota bacterium]